MFGLCTPALMVSGPKNGVSKTVLLETAHLALTTFTSWICYLVFQAIIQNGLWGSVKLEKELIRKAVVYITVEECMPCNQEVGLWFRVLLCLCFFLFSFLLYLHISVVWLIRSCNIFSPIFPIQYSKLFASNQPKLFKHGSACDRWLPGRRCLFRSEHRRLPHRGRRDLRLQHRDEDWANLPSGELILIGRRLSRDCQWHYSRSPWSIFM